MNAPTTLTVPVQVTIDEAAIRESLAATLRKLADELTAPTPDVLPDQPAPARYVLTRDRTGDYGVYDRETDTFVYTSSSEAYREATRRLVDALNAGAEDPSVLTNRGDGLPGYFDDGYNLYLYATGHNEYAPYTAVDSEEVFGE